MKIVLELDENELDAILCRLVAKLKAAECREATEINRDPLDLDELRAEYARIQPFDVAAFVAKHLILHQKRSLKDGGYKWVLEECPFNKEHTRSSAILQGVTGSVGFGCRHNSCKGKTWADVLALFEPPDNSPTP